MTNISIPRLPGAGGRPGKGILGFGAAGLALMAWGFLTLTNANTYTGNTTVTLGTLQLNNASAITNSPLVLNGGTLALRSNTGATFATASTSIAATSTVDVNQLTSGTNNVLLTLNENNGGIPGKVLHAWTFTNLPVFGTCCVLQTGKYQHGVPVTKDTMYWVVLRTTSDDTFDVWNNNFAGKQGPFSNNLGNGWVNGGIQELGAFGVFGR